MVSFVFTNNGIIYKQRMGRVGFGGNPKILLHGLKTHLAKLNVTRDALGNCTLQNKEVIVKII